MLPVFEQPLTEPEGIVSIPLEGGLLTAPRFTAIFTVRCPLEFETLQQVVGEVNAVMTASALERFGPLAMLIIGFLLFVVGGFAQTDPTAGIPPMVIIGFLLVAMGILGLFATARRRMLFIGKMRQKLGELNARFAARCIDFSLHEAHYLNMHYTSHHHAQMRVQTRYALVIQDLGKVGAFRVPAPEALAAQAMQGYNSGQPSAPPA